MTDALLKNAKFDWVLDENDTQVYYVTYLSNEEHVMMVRNKEGQKWLAMHSDEGYATNIPLPAVEDVSLLLVMVELWLENNQLKNNKEHYLLFSCNEWKEYSSMKPIGVFDRNHLNDILAKKIKNKDFDLDDCIEDIPLARVRDLDVSLSYGFITPVKINEEL